MDRFNEIKLFERVFNNSYNGLKLPRSARSYIDKCAYEYNDITLEVKMYHFAFLLKRGFDVCKELRKDIDYHMENPQYGSYEDTAKYTLIDMLQKLNSDNEYNYQLFEMHKKATFEEFFEMLKKELLANYHESKDGYDRFGGVVWKCKIDSAANLNC